MIDSDLLRAAQPESDSRHEVGSTWPANQGRAGFTPATVAEVLPWNPSASKHQRGFSLIEMIVVIAILGIVFGISFRFIATVGQWYDQTARQNRADEEALSAVTRLQREIRTLTATVTASGTEFRFMNANGQTNTVRWVSPKLTWNDEPLADGVNAFNMTYYDATNGVTTDTNLIRRVGLDFRVTDGSAVSEMNVNLFYPETGTMK